MSIKVEDFDDLIDMFTEIDYRNLTVAYIKKNSESPNFNWSVLSAHCNIKILEYILKNHQDKIVSISISSNKNLSEDLITEYKDHLDWNIIPFWCSLRILEENEDRVNWDKASFNVNLSRDLIRKYKDQVSFYKISFWCSLSILEEFQDNIVWRNASSNKNISDELIIKHKDNINWESISCFCSLKILEKFEDKINWNNASHNKNLNFGLIRKHKNELFTITITNAFTVTNRKNVIDILHLEKHKFKSRKTRWSIDTCPYSRNNSKDKKYRARHHQGILYLKSEAKQFKNYQD